MNKIYLSVVALVCCLYLMGCNEKNEAGKVPQIEKSPTMASQVKEDNRSIQIDPVGVKNTNVERNNSKVTLQQSTTQSLIVEQNNTIEPKTQDIQQICDPAPKTTQVQPSPKKNVYPEPVLKRTSCESGPPNHEKFDFDIIKKGSEGDNTLLVVGGIQGDEPGGFMAASLLATKYTIQKGSVWVVPNLNFYSIIKQSRGPYGDMNRKFATLDPSDPDYETIQRIKGYIKHDNVKLVLNLHDGSGFYSPMYIDKDHNPLRWGQSIVIDQEMLENVTKYNDLYTISEEVVSHLNNNLLKKEDIYRTKNTHTRFKRTFEEQEMSKTLTYYAIQNGKSAFGHETSKSLSVEDRVYYKLLALEKYMDIMGIKYKRDFNLNPAVIKNILDNDIEIAFYDNKIRLPLGQVRNMLRYFPVKKDGTIDFTPSNPLVSIIRNHDEYTIYYGNRELSKIKADFVEHIKENPNIEFIVDDSLEKYKFGDRISVKKSFLVKPVDGYRINVIGYTNSSKMETDVKITQNDMLKRFSIDKKGMKYRVEYYKDEKFAGMIVVDFAK